MEQCDTDVMDLGNLSHSVERCVCKEVGVQPDSVHGRCHMRYTQKPCVRKSGCSVMPGVAGEAAFWGRVIHLLKTATVLRPQDVKQCRVLCAQVWYHNLTGRLPVEQVQAIILCLSQPLLFRHLTASLVAILVPLQSAAVRRHVSAQRKSFAEFLQKDMNEHASTAFALIRDKKTP